MVALHTAEMAHASYYLYTVQNIPQMLARKSYGSYPYHMESRVDLSWRQENHGKDGKNYCSLEDQNSSPETPAAYVRQGDPTLRHLLPDAEPPHPHPSQLAVIIRKSFATSLKFLGARSLVPQSMSDLGRNQKSGGE